MEKLVEIETRKQLQNLLTIVSQWLEKWTSSARLNRPNAKRSSKVETRFARRKVGTRLISWKQNLNAREGDTSRVVFLWHRLVLDSKKQGTEKSVCLSEPVVASGRETFHVAKLRTIAPGYFGTIVQNVPRSWRRNLRGNKTKLPPPFMISRPIQSNYRSKLLREIVKRDVLYRKSEEKTID